MTTATAIEEEIEQYDPDNPPEDRGFLGRLTMSVNVSAAGQVTPSQGEDMDARIAEQCRTYAEKAGNYAYDLWYLEAEALDVIRDDGTPFRQRDIIKTSSAKGARLGANMAPAALATGFRDHGVSASPLKVGAEDSAVGRVFQFGTRDIKLGADFKKPVRLWPKELMDPDFVYEGEPRVIATRKEVSEEEGAPTDGGVASSLNQDEAVAILKEILHGKRPSEMVDVILADGRLSSVASVFGVALLESATDESLVGVLQENRVLAVGGDGTLVAL